MKRLSVVLVCLLLAVCAGAQITKGTYYYFRGKKIPLQISTEKFSVLVPSGTRIIASKAPGVEFEKMYMSIGMDVHVFRITSRRHIADAVGEMKKRYGRESIIQPCYKSIEGSDVILSNLLEVALFSPSDYESKLLPAMKRYHLEIAEHSDMMASWYTLTITPETGLDVLSVANALYESGLFAASAPSFFGELLDGEISYDEYVGEQWGLYNTYPGCAGIDISASAAWPYSTGSGIKIAFLDSGVYMQHPDLSQNIYAFSYDAWTKTVPSVYRGSHATECAGVAAASYDNMIGVAGVAPDAKIMSVSITSNATQFNSTSLMNGISWAWQHGADVLNLSLALEGYSPCVAAAIDSALCFGRSGRGCVITASAGNNPSLNALYPASHSDDVISVSAIKYNGDISDYHPHPCDSIDVVGPGQGIMTTSHGTYDYGYVSGTSYACAHVSGVAALVLQSNPFLYATDVRDIIEENTKHVGSVTYSPTTGKTHGDWNNQYGYGLVDAYSAVLDASPYFIEMAQNRSIDENDNIGELILKK